MEKGSLIIGVTLGQAERRHFTKGVSCAKCFFGAVFLYIRSRILGFGDFQDKTGPDKQNMRI